MVTIIGSALMSTPIIENGSLTGYESVRVKPSREQIERAQTIYARLRTGKDAVPLNHHCAVFLAKLALPIIAATLSVCASTLLPGALDQAVTAGLFLVWDGGCIRERKLN